MEILIVIIVMISGGIINGMLFEVKRKSRRDYYRNDYLKSDAWKRKRFVVLRRDNWICKYCGGKATQVHHLNTLSTISEKSPSIGWCRCVGLVMISSMRNLKIGLIDYTTTIV